MPNTMPAATECKYNDLSLQYEGGGSLTVASFTMNGVRYCARKFWRADMGCRGIELYRVNTGRVARREGLETLVRMIPESGEIWRSVDLKARYLVKQTEALASYPEDTRAELELAPLAA